MLTERSQFAADGGTGWRAHPYTWTALLLVGAAAWVMTVQQAGNMTGMSGMAGMTPGPTSALVFLPVWIAMMVAMMLPAVAPVVSLVGTVSRKRREAGNQAVPTAVFVAGYLVVWTVFGVAAYLLSLAVPSLDMAAPGLKSSAPVVAGLILMFAGFYEWSPLKAACLRHCRSPLGTFMWLWRDGAFGAFRLGFVHGAYCLGCCWGLMLVLFVVGLMNLMAMVVLAVVIFAQKVLPRGDVLGRVAGAVLVASGLAFAVAHAI